MTTPAKESFLQSLKDKDYINPLEDGYHYFWPEASHGFYTAQQLRWIAGELDRLNGPVREHHSKASSL